jgi:hypothetical protein
MGQVIGNIIGIVLVLAAITIVIKLLFFVLGLVGLLFGLVGVLLKLAVIGGMLYLGWLVLAKVFGKKEAF